MLEAWRGWGPDACPGSGACSPSPFSTRHTGALVLARDHLGIKPLHYLPRKDGVVFASELKALVAASARAGGRAGRPVASTPLLLGARPSAARSRACQKLAAGLVGRVPPRRPIMLGTLLVDRRRWRPRRAAGPPAPTWARSSRQSVAAHLVADVPVSSFLSGGLDSSIVTVLAKRANPDIDAYTITFRPEDQRLEAMPDDAVYARKVAAQFGIKLHEIEISPDIVDLLPRIVDVLDEPIGDPAAINTLLMCEAARDARRQGDAVGHGRRRALRRLPQASGLRDGQPLPPPARHGPARACAFAVDRLPVVAAGRGLRYARWAKRFLTFAELPEEAAVPAQLHPLRPGRARRPGQPGPGRPRR